MNKPIHDLHTDAPRYMVQALEAAKGPLSLDVLACDYKPPKPNNMADIRAQYRDEYIKTNVDALRELLSDAAHCVNAWNRDAHGGDVIVITNDDYDPNYQLAEGVDVDDLLAGPGEPLVPRPVFTGLFDPEKGKWRENIRTPNPKGFKELEDSMRAIGWLKDLPAIRDEHDVVIVGHRRLKVAADLGIEPVIRTITFGDGEAGDAKRAALAIASNVGTEKLSPADRKVMAETLYVETGWSMQRIGALLKTSTMTVSRDLRGLIGVKPPERGGRPRSPKPEPEPAALQLVSNPVEPEADTAQEEVEAVVETDIETDTELYWTMKDDHSDYVALLRLGSRCVIAMRTDEFEGENPTVDYNDPMLEYFTLHRLSATALVAALETALNDGIIQEARVSSIGLGPTS
jgi:ParB-like chromosome segregation protein Spo0J